MCVQKEGVSDLENGANMMNISRDMMNNYWNESKQIEPKFVELEQKVYI